MTFARHTTSEKRPRFYVSVLGIAASVLVLIGLLGYYTYANHQREQDLMVRFLTREGSAFVRAIEAGARAAMMGPNWRNDLLRQLVEETVRTPGVVYIQILQGDGRVLTSAGQPDGPDLDGLSPTLEAEGTVAWMTEDPKIFHVAEVFDPFRAHPAGLPGHDRMWQRWRNWCRMMGTSPGSSGQVAVVGLRADPFFQAQAEDVRRAAGTGAIILLLGAAAISLLFVIQSRYTIKRALEDTRSYAQNVVESISNGVITVDRRGEVASINHVACEMLGVSPETAQGAHYARLLSGGSCELEPTIEKGISIREKEMTCVGGDGVKIEASVSASQLRNETGEALGAVVVLRDLKEIRKLEEQLRRSERLAGMGRMVAGVAHELRNPLSSIKGFGSLFQRKFDASSDEGQCAQLLVQEVDRLNRVITDLLSFAQPTELRLVEMNIGELVEHSLLLCASEIQEKATVVEKDYSAGLTARADKDLLIQVMVNLFRNAVEAMSENGRLTISAKAVDSEVEVCVSDTGCGMAEADRTQVFDPFYTSKKGGTGLGLAIVHSIIDVHKGQIDVESQPNAGTTFRILLPSGV